MAHGLSDSRKAFSLISSYLREEHEIIPVNLTMPLKLAVKRFDGSYRTKLVPDDVPLALHDAYMSKREELIWVFEIDTENVPESLQDVRYVEMPHGLISDRLESISHDKLIKSILEATNGEIDRASLYSAPIKTEYGNNEFGSW